VDGTRNPSLPTDLPKFKFNYKIFSSRLEETEGLGTETEPRSHLMWELRQGESEADLTETSPCREGRQKKKKTFHFPHTMID